MPAWPWVLKYVMFRLIFTPLAPRLGILVVISCRQGFKLEKHVENFLGPKFICHLAFFGISLLGQGLAACKQQVQFVT